MKIIMPIICLVTMSGCVSSAGYYVRDVQKGANGNIQVTRCEVKYSSFSDRIATDESTCKTESR
jgi:hypothetical protein